MLHHKNRYWDIRDGRLMVVSDLHGQRAAFDRYIQTFLEGYSEGLYDRLILLGDLIHGYGDEAEDASLSMVLDVIDLQARYGAETVMMLLGNHELPHIYGISLAKGEHDFSARFERQLRGHREKVLTFFKGLPLAVRTGCGVLLTHAGPDEESINRLARLNSFSHDELLHDADYSLAQHQDLNQVYETYAEMSGQSYAALAKTYLDVEGPDDPRYSHLVRALLIAERDSRFPLIWDFLFSTNERGLPPAHYEQVCRRYLDAISIGAPVPQVVCVSGHIDIPDGGYKVVNARHLRLASAHHAPRLEDGLFLELDCSQRIRQASDLVGQLRSVYG